jgi:hypothetical protein
MSVRKIYGLVKAGLSWRIRTDKDIKDMLLWGRYCKIKKKFPRLR